MKTEEQKYHHNIAITAVFNSVYGCLYFAVAKTPQAGAKDTRRRQRVTLWNLKKANLVITLCHTKNGKNWYNKLLLWTCS